MKTIKAMKSQQRGAGFLGWVSVVGLVIFAFVTGVKLMPEYLEFQAVKSLVQEIAADPAVSSTDTRQISRKIDDYLNVNGLNSIKREYFTLVTLPEKKNARALQVSYEVRKHWLANIDFLLVFKHTEDLKK